MERKVTAKKKISGTKANEPKKRKRRRISGTADIKEGAMLVGGIGLGSVVGREAAVYAGNLFPSLQAHPGWVGIAEALIGWFGPKHIKGNFAKYFGYGLIANGVNTGLVGFGVISGPKNMMAYKISGTDRLPVVNGTDRLPVVNGQNRVIRTPMQPVRVQKQFRTYV